MFFEWDPNKASANLQKHRVSFGEAESVFADPFSLDVFDPLHSIDEDRFVKIGKSEKSRLLVIAYVERVGRIRIISARKATPREQKTYKAN